MKRSRFHELVREFGKDLAAGKLNSLYLLSDILEMIDFLELEWPSEAVCMVIDDYLDQVLAANEAVPPFQSLLKVSEAGSANEALCRFLVHLLAFPVMDVDVAARKALSRHATTDGDGFATLLRGEPCWDSVQLEHILVSLHVGSCTSNAVVNSLRDWIMNLNEHESIAVRSIARRLCEEQGWPWKEIANQPVRPVIFMSESLAGSTDYKEARMLVGGDVSTALLLHRIIFASLERAGLDPDELRSEFYQLFRQVERAYNWVDENRLIRWMRLVLAKFWVNPRAIVGREAAMRVLGRRSRIGAGPSGCRAILRLSLSDLRPSA